MTITSRYRIQRRDAGRLRWRVMRRVTFNGNITYQEVGKFRTRRAAERCIALNTWVTDEPGVTS